MTMKRRAQATEVDVTKRAEGHNTTNKRVLEAAKMSLVTMDVEKRFESGASDGAAPGASNAAPEDPWETLAAEGRIVQAPFDLFSLSQLREQSSELGQCVDAMVANIDQLGHRQVPRVKIEDPEIAEKIGEGILKKIKEEYVMLQNFFEYCTNESFTEFRLKYRTDLEQTGNTYFEVIRDAKDAVQQFVHLPSYQMRLAKQDDEAIQYDRKIMKMQVEDYSVEIDTVKEYRRFRRFVQGRSVQGRVGFTSSTKLVWFKSFGDPRHLNKNTGEYESEASEGKAAVIVPVRERATEVIHTAIYCSRSPYGLPRYIGNLLSIYGDRAAEEINFTTFKNNNIPSMMIMVSGGQLTDATIDRLKTFTESQIQNSDNRSKFIIVEAETVADEGEDQGQVRIQVERMVKDQHNDALFQNYSEKNQDKIRRCYRLPPLLVGRADDYTRTTAETSKRVADEQVFQPNRNEFDNLFNRVIYPVMGVQFHKFKSNTPSTTDNESLINILANAEKTGGVTPRIARKILEMVLSEDLGPFPKDFDADVPFSVTMAEAVKNVGDPAEPGQQVTALKRAQTSVRAVNVLKAFFGDDFLPDAIPDGEDPTLFILKRMNEKLEVKWQSEVTATPHEL